MKTSREVIQRARESLNLIRHDLDALKSNTKDATVKNRSLRNIIVWGRTVTFILQNLRSVVGAMEFDEWYKPYQDEMKNDKLLLLFKDARNNLEKQGVLNTTLTIKFSNVNLNIGEIIKKHEPNKPPHAKSFFIGDQFGGSGWEIELPDGTIEKFYVDIEIDKDWEIEVSLVNETIKHLGEELTNKSIENFLSLFYAYLKNLVDSAALTFVK